MPELRQRQDGIRDARLMIEQDTAEIRQSRQITIEYDGRCLIAVSCVRVSRLLSSTTETSTPSTR